MSRPKKPRGGRRDGAGRPPLCEGRPKLVTFHIRMDAAERALILARGGADYIRRLIAADTMNGESIATERRREMETTMAPVIRSFRVEQRAASQIRLPGLSAITSPAHDVLLVEVEHWGRQAGGPLDHPRTLEFSVQGDASDGYRGINPNDRAAIEDRVLEAHHRDLADWRAGD